ncbi:MAG TPA: pyridoxal-phosphate dependent enzyme [Polyangiaceae bacterium]|nr:pyridoxal-phosphate dependent enzyme [Polyangiaceae bacterium]
MSAASRPLFDIWPALERDLGFLALGDFPTPIERLDRIAFGAAGLAGETYVKRDDLSSPVYGGNKVRTLEALLGQARREGKGTIVATGAYGSNHSVASVLHARRVGFRTAAMLFPQPYSATALENLRVSVALADEVTDLLHWSLLPFAIWRRERAARLAPPGALVMRPGGAIPRGCLGFMSAGLELARQVEQGLMPPPDEVVIALGSTCSTAGLLVGMRLAARLGIAWGRASGTGRDAGPLLVAVRVTPWPVTSPVRVLNLARATCAWLLQLTGRREFDLSRAELARHLVVDGSQLGRGYGLPTAAGLGAIERLAPFSAALDTTYAAKSAAAVLERLGRGPSVRLFWSTKSSAALPDLSEEALARAPRRMRRWMEHAESR